MVDVAETDSPARSDDVRNLKILVADDHQLFRGGFKLLLSSIFKAPQVIDACDANDAWERLEREQNFDIVFLDLAMPGMNGVQGIQRFVQRHPDIPFVVISGYADPSDIIKSINLGARGFIPKAASEDILRHATSLVLAGEVFLPSTAIDRMSAQAEGDIARELENLAADNPLRLLTNRQRDTLALMIEGLSNKEIARRLGLLESTVKAHVKVVLKKLDAQNRTQAVLVAADLGWPRKSLSPQS